MFPKVALLSLSFLAIAFGQQIGTNTAETHPSLTWETCTSSGCTTNTGSVVLDSNWRWVHNVGGSTNCYTGNTWDATLCPNDATCAANCALDGANYSGTYGVTTSGNALTLDFVTGSNVGSRLYLLSSNTEYQKFDLLNSEFAFDVNVSQLPCGLNGALYFSEMPLDGGVSAFPTNKAGAEYGTGYCDSQCPRDLKFIDGQGNVAGWVPDTNNANTGIGNTGACCNEMDVWEANSVSAAFTPHPCSETGLTACNGTACGGPTNRYGSICDPDGCDFNSYRMGDTTFYGPSLTVDTTQKFTVVTQFLTTTGTSSGTLNQIRRIYVQNGKVIQNSAVDVPGMSDFTSITPSYCSESKVAFNNTNSFGTQGGFSAISNSMANGMVLVMSLWDDYYADMLWLDSSYPTTASPSTPGVARGTCATTSGVPATVEADSPNSSVTYSNIKFGSINSTYSATGSSSSSSSGSPTTTSSSASSTSTGGTQVEYGQCGGTGWTGPTTCVAGTTCVYSNPYYSQCLA